VLQDNQMDIFSVDIQEVSLLKKGAEWGPTDYVVSGSNMDGVSFSRLPLNFLLYFIIIEHV
jgi:hypothetical protein